MTRRVVGSVSLPEGLLPRGALPVRAQQGIVMVTAMILLIVLTVLSIAMFQNFGLLERISGNSREKQKSFAMAQTALSYAEAILPNWPNSADACASGTTYVDSGGANAVPKICDMPLTTAQLNGSGSSTTLLGNWPTGVQYTPALPTGASVSFGSACTTSGGTGYAMPPMYHIYPEGKDKYGNIQLFLVSAISAGGTCTATTVLQSTYGLTSTSRDAGAQ
jgi:type IV pilus assembly protein PilX